MRGVQSKYTQDKNMHRDKLGQKIYVNLNLRIAYISIYMYTLLCPNVEEVEGAYWFRSVSLSVCLSVCLSVRIVFHTVKNS